MAVSFPQNPQVGDTYIANNFVYIWDGQAWVSQAGLTGGAGPGATGPTGPAGADGATGATGAGGSSSKIFTATGPISDGDPCVVNDDGTASKVAAENKNEPKLVDSAEASSVTADYIETVSFPPNSNVYMLFNDKTNNRGTVQEVDVSSGGEITYGSANIFLSGNATYLKGAYDSSFSHVSFVYRDSANSNLGTLGYVSSNMSTGSGQTFTTGTSSDLAIAYIASRNHVVIAYKDSGATNSNGIYVVVAEKGSTSSTFGTPVEVASSGSKPDMVYDPDNDVIVLSYRDDSTQGIKAVAGTTSGTGSSSTISFGSAVTVNTNPSNFPSLTYDTVNDKAVVVYQESSGGVRCKGAVLSISGTTITAGTSSTIWDSALGTPTYIDSDFDSTNGVIFASLRYYDSTAGEYAVAGITCKVSGTTLQVGENTTISTADIDDPSCGFVASTGHMVVSYKAFNGSNNYVGNSTVDTTAPSSNMQNGGFIGFSDEAISGGASGNISMTGSVNESQSGLTTGSKYYVLLDGTLSTTPAAGLSMDDNNYVVGGVALSSTDILVG